MLVSIQVSAQIVTGDIRNYVVSTSHIDITFKCNWGKVLVYIWEDEKIVFCDILKPYETRRLKTISSRGYKSKCYSVGQRKKRQLFDESLMMKLDNKGRIPIGYNSNHTTNCIINKA